MAQAVREREQQVPIPGVKRLEGSRAVLQRRLVLAVTVIPFIGFAAAVYSLWGRGLSGADAGIALFFYVFTGLGITIDEAEVRKHPFEQEIVQRVFHSDGSVGDW